MDIIAEHAVLILVCLLVGVAAGYTLGRFGS